jgi:hypothetical protein
MMQTKNNSIMIMGLLFFVIPVSWALAGCDYTVSFSPDGDLFSVDHIIDIQLYGAFMDSSEFTLSETFGRNLIHSLKPDSTIKAFCKSPWAWERYSLSKAPCIKIFFLSPRETEEGWPFNFEDWILFNACDSSACFFGANPNEYYKVSHDLIGVDSSDSNILNFVLLYLQIRAPRFCYYYIMQSAANFDSLYTLFRQKGYYKEDSILRPPEKRMKDISIAQEYIKPIKINKLKDRIEIKLFTWEELGGELEFWHFLIKANSMKLLERTSSANEVGPYIMMLH